MRHMTLTPKGRVLLHSQLLRTTIHKRTYSLAPMRQTKTQRNRRSQRRRLMTPTTQSLTMMSIPMRMTLTSTLRIARTSRKRLRGISVRPDLRRPQQLTAKLVTPQTRHLPLHHSNKRNLPLLLSPASWICSLDHRLHPLSLLAVLASCNQQPHNPSSQLSNLTSSLD